MSLKPGERQRLAHEYEFGSRETRARAATVFNEAPTINLASKFFWNAWHELETERGIGMDVGPIPFSKIMAYADEYGLRGTERECLLKIIRALDQRSLTIRAERHEAESKKATKSNGRGHVMGEW